MQCGRVGSRLLSNKREPHDESCEALFFSLPRHPQGRAPPPSPPPGGVDTLVRYGGEAKGKYINLVFLEILDNLDKLEKQVLVFSAQLFGENRYFVYFCSR